MPTGGTERRELSTWGEIAEHLGVSIRTAQHWEKDKGLPVRRLAGEKGRVWAIPVELDRWREAHLVEKPTERPASRAVGLWAVVATAGLLLAAGAYLVSTRKGPPADFHHDGRSLVVTDEQGRELWRKPFAETFHRDSTPEKILENKKAWFGDLDGDGRVELLYAYAPTTRESTGDILFCFSETGREKWRFVPGKTVASRVASFPPPYHLARLMPMASDRDRTKRIVVTSFHGTRYPSQVVVLSHQGAVLGEYWHSGHLGKGELADLDGDGNQEIVFAGISNGYGAATLLVLDPSDLGGASHEGNPDYQLQSLPAGREKARLLFPRTCINRKFDPYGAPHRLVVRGDSIEVAVSERTLGPEGVNLLAFYYLNRRLELTNVLVNDPFKVYHRELEAAGQLDHPLTEKEVAELRNIRYLKRLGP